MSKTFKTSLNKFWPLFSYKHVIDMSGFVITFIAIFIDYSRDTTFGSEKTVEPCVSFRYLSFGSDIKCFLNDTLVVMFSGSWCLDVMATWRSSDMETDFYTALWTSKRAFLSICVCEITNKLLNAVWYESHSRII